MIGPAMALLACIPLAVGSLPAEPRTLTMQLCGGGTITIPLDGQGQDRPPCNDKACHAGTCREKFDRHQGLKHP